MHALRRTAAGLLALTLAAAPAGSATSQARATCLGRVATIVGTDRADRLVGTRRADVIVGRGGGDRIDGRGGADRICGGRGADRLVGGRGADRLHGGPDQRIRGAAGSYLLGDVLVGGPGRDVLDGGVDARDVDRRRRPDTYSWADAPRPVRVDLSGPERGTATGRGRDVVVLGPAHRIVGSSYADTIIGSRRPDRIHGGRGGDRIRAGGGPDLVFPDSSSRDRGRDRVSTGRGDDLVSSSAGRDVIRTGRGRDFVEAFSRRPTVVALGAGDDYAGQRVTPGRGARVAGGAGDDVVAFYGTLLAGQRPRARFVVDRRRGVTRASGSVRAEGTISGVEGHRLLGPLRWRFFGSPGADRVWAIQGGPLRAQGFGGRDELIGSDRADVLDGGPASDRADGRGGRDRCRRIERGPC